jgi:hypothetical protein
LSIEAALDCSDTVAPRERPHPAVVAVFRAARADAFLSPRIGGIRALMATILEEPRKEPRRSRRLVRVAKKPSTALSQEALVG